MFELIQYAPTTETVHETPLIIFPPWINKFYILDLKPQNSLIKWIVDQGYTLFVVSAGSTPTPAIATSAWTTMSRRAISPRSREVKAITGERQGQRGRLLHRRHHAGADAGAA